MKSTFSILFYLKRNGVKANGNMPIIGRITVNGNAVQFSTKTEIHPNHWNVEAGKAIGKEKEIREVNAILESIKATMTKIYRDLQERESSVTPERIKNIFFGIEVKQQMLLDLFNRYNEDLSKLIGIKVSKVTYSRYQLTKSRIGVFLQERYNMSDIPIKDINHMFLKDFETYLLATCKCNTNSAAKFLQRLKTIIQVAKNNGWIHVDPFANYKIRFTKVDRGFLIEEELKTIMEKQFASKRLEQVRDIFIFSCFTGLAYIDLMNLQESNISTFFDGNLWIITKRQKTNVQSNVPLLKVAKQILEKYKGTLPNGKVLPVISNQKINAYLKEIAEICGIERRLTFHLARHTFATTVTLSNDVPIESVSKMLGHTNIKTTQIYARIVDKKVSKDMELLAGKLTGIENCFSGNQ